jgi:predicted metal-dependent phosphoesterase TrpH
MAVDLHSHSRYSDGSDAPAEIIRKAKTFGLSAVALTDHDLLDGLPEATTAAADAGIELVPGAELSVQWQGKGMHLLAYWIEPQSPLGQRLDEIQRGRVTRNHEMVDALVGLGIDITMEELEAEAEMGVIGRPHFAAILVRKGVVDTIGDAFEQYLAAGRVAYRPRIRVDAAEGIALTWESDGVPVVAHPHTLADDAAEFGHLLPEFKDLGAGGIECYYVEYAQSLREDLARRVDELGLVATGGSDYHGTYKPGIELGSGKGDLSVPDSCLERLSAIRPGR